MLCCGKIFVSFPNFRRFSPKKGTTVRKTVANACYSAGFARKPRQRAGSKNLVRNNDFNCVKMGCGHSTQIPAKPTDNPQKTDEQKGKEDPAVFPSRRSSNSSNLSSMSSYRDWRDCVSFTTFIHKAEQPQIFEYKFIKSIGHGSHGEVFMVQHTETGNIYAAKIYDKLQLYNNGLGVDEQPLDRVYREMQVMAFLKHPNIINLIEILDDDYTNSFIFIIDYADKGSLLRQQLTSDPIPEDVSQKIFAQVAFALQYIHSMNVIHRDIKPENIMMNSDGKACLGDFSVAGFIEDENDEIDDTEGTPAFFSPEECTGMPFRAKPVDVWALGVSLYHMIFGKLPFFDIDEDGYFISQLFKISQDIQNKPLVFLSNIEISDDLHDLFIKILNKDPAKRLTIDEVVQHPWVAAVGYVPDMTNYPQVPDTE